MPKESSQNELTNTLNSNIIPNYESIPHKTPYGRGILISPAKDKDTRYKNSAGIRRRESITRKESITLKKLNTIKKEDSYCDNNNKASQQEFKEKEKNYDKFTDNLDHLDKIKSFKFYFINNNWENIFKKIKRKKSPTKKNSQRNSRSPVMQNGLISPVHRNSHFKRTEIQNKENIEIDKKNMIKT